MGGEGQAHRLDGVVDSLDFAVVLAAASWPWLPISCGVEFVACSFNFSFTIRLYHLDGLAERLLVFGVLCYMRCNGAFISLDVNV